MDCRAVLPLSIENEDALRRIKEVRNAAAWGAQSPQDERRYASKFGALIEWMDAWVGV